MIRISLLTIALAMILATGTRAQEYVRSAGVRLGSETTALTFKKFASEDQAVEVFLSGRSKGLQLTLMYEKYLPMRVGTLDNFYFYSGMGGHVGYQKDNEINKVPTGVAQSDFYYTEEDYFEIGIDGIVGIEYRILSIPLSINVDLKPFVSYVGFEKLEGDFWDGSVGVKYIF